MSIKINAGVGAVDRKKGKYMLRSCPYCGRIHDTKFDCGKKPKSEYKRKYETAVRYTTPMKKKSVEIKEKAHYICEVCADEGTVFDRSKEDREHLETHHIIKLVDIPDLALDNSNLICLCRYHHELAEKGAIDADYLRKLAQKRENR